MRDPASLPYIVLSALAACLAAGAVMAVVYLGGWAEPPRWPAAEAIAGDAQP